jgi:hypothetical protein
VQQAFTAVRLAARAGAGATHPVELSDAQNALEETMRLSLSSGDYAQVAKKARETIQLAVKAQTLAQGSGSESGGNAHRERKRMTSPE